MSLVTMKEMLVQARKNVYAVGAFEFWSHDSAQAIVKAAEELNMPVILQAGFIECEYAGGMKNLSKIAKMVADDTSVPVALHLDHGDTYELACQAIDAGFTSVMIDSSHLSFEENVNTAKKVVALAKSAGVSVEAELGRLAGAEGNLDINEEEAMQTDPDEAKRFVDETGIDTLAVAIGTAHGFYKFTPRINISRLKKIAEKVDIPLVLHGGSGTPDEKVVEAIKYGISKVNICTEFIAAFGKSYSNTQSSAGFKYSIPSFFTPAKASGKALVYSKIKLFSGK
ncbi:MAG: class II fructose-bisphosphate aldolase [Clostridiales bacterium]|nr:class II fructose-bisphosphate aldolase [Clostridiales bacterium]